MASEHNIREVEVSEDELRREQREFAAKKQLTVGQLYERMDLGEYRGTILESKLSMLRFLLGEDAPAPAAE
jgi:hypothetical protein